VAHQFTDDGIVRSDLILQQITAGDAGPVLVADFQAFSSAPRLSHLISTRAQGRPVYQVDPLNALSGDRAYMSLADMAAEAAEELGRSEPANGPASVIGYCSAAALALHVATLLARSQPTVAVLLRPSWPDEEMITTQFATLVANLRTSARPNPVLDDDPGECVTRMEQVLRSDMAAMAASQGLEGSEDTFAELLMTYRSWLAFLLACRNDPRSAWADGGAEVTVLTELPEPSVPRLSPSAVKHERLPEPGDKNPVTPEVVDLVVAQITIGG
jgi:hypothetical protein